MAEQFGTLEALYPGRIDLGIGRAPGTNDALTSAALRRVSAESSEEFSNQLTELMEYFAPANPNEPRSKITAGAAAENRPPIWLLGSSVTSAALAGSLGLPYAFAYQGNSEAIASALETYRDSFCPSTRLDSPYVMVGVKVIVGESDEHASDLAASSLLGLVLARSGRLDPYLPPEEAKNYNYTDEDRKFLQKRTNAQIIGGPDTVRRKIDELTISSRANEIMALTLVYDHADRVRSYELLADTIAA